MNAKPHTHEVRIEEGSYRYYLTYGDQSKQVGKRWLECEKTWRRRNAKTLNRMINRRLRKMIRRHDRESVKAGNTVVPVEQLAQKYNQHLVGIEKTDYGTRRTITKEAWGAELLKEKEVVR